MCSLCLLCLFPLGPSLCRGSLLRPGGCLSRLLRPGGRLTCQSRPSGRLTCQSPPTSPPTCQSPPTSPPTCQSHPTSADLPESPHVSADLTESPHVSADLPESLHVSAVSSAPPWWAPVSLAPHGPGPPFPPPVPPPSWIMLCVKHLEAALRGGGSVMNLVATHYNCTSPMDYISHHALHSHIPIHHYTNHTAVTIHSLALIVSPHLHLIHTHLSSTLTCTHREVLFLPRLTFLSIFPVFCYPVFDPGLPDLGTLNLCL